VPAEVVRFFIPFTDLQVFEPGQRQEARDRNQSKNNELE
jgi:hypothetical protein